MMDYLSALHKPFSGATMLCAALLLTACEAEEPAVDTGKLVGVWELFYSSYAGGGPFYTQEGKEAWISTYEWEKHKHYVYGSPGEIGKFFMLKINSDGTAQNYQGERIQGKYYLRSVQEWPYIVSNDILQDVGEAEHDWFDCRIIKCNQYVLILERYPYGETIIGDHFNCEIYRFWFSPRGGLPFEE
jgi:hypothetical protein